MKTLLPELYTNNSYDGFDHVTTIWLDAPHL